MHARAYDHCTLREEALSLAGNVTLYKEKIFGLEGITPQEARAIYTALGEQLELEFLVEDTFQKARSRTPERLTGIHAFKKRIRALEARYRNTNSDEKNEILEGLEKLAKTHAQTPLSQ